MNYKRIVSLFKKNKNKKKNKKAFEAGSNRSIGFDPP
jgi:hypothetical protein